MKITVQNSLYLLILLISVTAELQVVVTNVCNYNVFPNTYAVGWAPGFAERKFRTFQTAQIQCDRTEKCQAITQTQLVNKGENGENVKSVFFTLRSTTRVVTQIFDVKEVTYVKQSCQACDYQVYYGTKLSGCVNNCQDYPTLQDAQIACKAITSCGGITLSHKHFGGSQTSDPISQKFGYQLRASSIPEVSINNEDSWVKNICPISFIEKDHYEIPGEEEKQDLEGNSYEEHQKMNGNEDDKDQELRDD